MRQFVAALFALLLLSGCTGRAQVAGGKLELHFIDVGQGDAILIRSPSGQNVLVDGGRKDDEALNYLRAIGVQSVYMVIASHADADHIGGLEAVVRHYRPPLFMDNEIPSESQTYEGLLRGVAEAGSQVAAPTARRVNLGGASLRVIPPPGIGEWGSNDNSIGIIIEYGEFGAGLTGDAEDSEFGWWLENGMLEPALHDARGAPETAAHLDATHPQNDPRAGKADRGSFGPERFRLPRHRRVEEVRLCTDPTSPPESSNENLPGR